MDNATVKRLLAYLEGQVAEQEREVLRAAVKLEVLQGLLTSVRQIAKDEDDGKDKGH